MTELYPYFERELGFMRELAGEFAERYPHVASRLALERHGCDDPHVERLIEAFSLIAARIHHRLDADFPEVSQSLLNLVYPHFLRPVPSMSIAQFQPSAADRVRERIHLPRGIKVEIGEELCKFRSAYAVDLWPIRISEATVVDNADIPIWARAKGTSAGVLLRLASDVPLAELQGFDHLRIYLAGAGRLPFALFDLVCRDCSHVLLRDAAQPRAIPRRLAGPAIRAVGYGNEQNLLPSDTDGRHGLRLIQEYFCFPRKFLFFDLLGLSAIREIGVGFEADLFFAISEEVSRTPEFELARHTTTKDNFLLGCTPVVNLFSHTAEPIRVDHTVFEKLIIPDGTRGRAYEVFSIDAVESRDPSSWRREEYRPFYSFSHGDLGAPLFWHATRRRSSHGVGTEVFLSMVDPKLQPAEMLDQVIEVRTTCSNRDLPQRLDLKLTFGEIRLSDERVLGRLVHRPSESISPPIGDDITWRVISMLGFNYQSLASPTGDSGAGLREILSLYNFGGNPTLTKQIAAVRGVRSEPRRARLTMQQGKVRVPSFCHGTKIWLDIDADAFSTGGAYLFANVMEQFFSMFRSVNSFTELTVLSHSSATPPRAEWNWPPRTGQQEQL